VRATIWGCRGSLATPGERTLRYGGNTSSIEVRTAAGGLVILDAGTGIRPLGRSFAKVPARVDLLLTHLHLDHVEGLGFFAPLFDPNCSITIWGPHQEGSSLAAEIASYLSPPLFPVPFEELPARIDFVERGDETWQLDGLTITAATVRHPGTTLAYRLEEEGRSLAYIPDNELGLEPQSGAALAAGANVLFHDAQFTAEEYRTRVGWGHSSLDQLPPFVEAAAPGRMVMFHHDPSHSDDFLDSMRATLADGTGRPIELAAERSVYDV
jgi:phosphoribosyl 1,2-cyclic phosphodiesterase